jgi:hypothetical protein
MLGSGSHPWCIPFPALSESKAERLPTWMWWKAISMPFTRRIPRAGGGWVPPVLSSVLESRRRLHFSNRFSSAKTFSYQPTGANAKYVDAFSGSDL